MQCLIFLIYMPTPADPAEWFKMSIPPTCLNRAPDIGSFRCPFCFASWCGMCPTGGSVLWGCACAFAFPFAFVPCRRGSCLGYCPLLVSILSGQLSGGCYMVLPVLLLLVKGIDIMHIQDITSFISLHHITNPLVLGLNCCNPLTDNVHACVFIHCQHR